MTKKSFDVSLRKYVQLSSDLNMESALNTRYYLTSIKRDSWMIPSLPLYHIKMMVSDRGDDVEIESEVRTNARLAFFASVFMFAFILSILLWLIAIVKINGFIVFLFIGTLWTMISVALQLSEGKKVLNEMLGEFKSAEQIRINKIFRDNKNTPPEFIDLIESHDFNKSDDCFRERVLYVLSKFVKIDNSQITILEFDGSLNDLIFYFRNEVSKEVYLLDMDDHSFRLHIKDFEMLFYYDQFDTYAIYCLFIDAIFLGDFKNITYESGVQHLVWGNELLNQIYNYDLSRSEYDKIVSIVERDNLLN